MTGFQKWWKLNPKLHEHEVFESHLRCLEKWKIYTIRLKTHKIIDAETISFMEKEKKHWRNILYRLLDITLFLSRQN